jgi:hypothetical protein
LAACILAWAVPDFAWQTCLTCHADSFGSALRSFDLQPAAGTQPGGQQSWQPLSAMTLPASFAASRDAPTDHGSPIGEPAHVEMPGDGDGIGVTALDVPYLLMPRRNTIAMTFGAPAQFAASGAFSDNPGNQAVTSEGSRAAGTPWLDSFSPRWHVALQRDLQRHFLQIGTYGLPVGTPSGVTTTAVSASYRFKTNPAGSGGGSLSAHATMARDVTSPVSGVIFQSNDGHYAPDAFRLGSAYSFDETTTPSVQYFRIAGMTNSPQFGWPTTRPNSGGVIAEVAYLPWAGSTSPIQFLNLRFAARYVASTEFSGMAHGTAGNSAVNLSLWGALRF